MRFEKEQEKHIYQVLEFIEAHINESLPLEKLADVSTYSPFYFQRLFKGIVGESPASYIRRLRIEKGAHLLIYEQHIPITEIAFMCGFTSLSYFTASFQKYFHTSPKKWREGAYLEHFPREYEDSKKSKVFSNKEKESDQTGKYNEFKWLDLANVKVIDIPDCTAIKRFKSGPYTDGIPEVWEGLYHWANARSLITEDTLFFGIPKNNPYITPPEYSRYECCLALEDAYDSEEEITFPFPGGRHVLYEFESPVDYSERGKLIECYSELYSMWLPKSGFRYLGNPIELTTLEPMEGTLKVTSKIKAIALAIEPK